MNRVEFNAPLIAECAAVSEAGGSFEIRNYYEGNWFTEYKIFYPVNVMDEVSK
ncbi:MAG: hypothetical protein ACYCZJ_13315 [Sulfuriferula sp.]